MAPHPRSPSTPCGRRRFLRGGGCVLAAGALPLAGCGGGGSGAPTTAAAAAPSPAPAPTPASAPVTTAEQDVLNFALNLHYLGAQFYAYASGGVGVAAALLTGSGAPGAASGARAVAFTDPVVARLAAEIAADKLASLTAVRAALGNFAVAQPRLDLSPDSGGAFATAAGAAGLVPASTGFDPYASDEAFLLSASMFEGVAAAAHRASLSLLSPGAGLEAQSAAIGVAAYHAGVVRSALDALAVDRPDVRTRRLALAGLEAKLDPPPASGQVAVDGGAITDLPDDGGPLPYRRSAQRALRALYAYAGGASAGGFFPSGLNGVIRASA